MKKQKQIKLSYGDVKSVFDTLPIGYYLGTKVDNELSSTESGSYYDPVKNKIVISFPMLAKSCKQANKKMTEQDIRSMLYHEVSHIILTPNYYTNYKGVKCSLRWNGRINIFEDFRIEEILKNYYYGTDFEYQVRLINNHWQPEIPESADSLFYDVVRYNEGPQELLDMKWNIFESYKDINGASPIKSRNFGAFKWKWYCEKIENLYKKCKELFPEFKKEQEQKQNSESQKEQGEQSEQNGQGSESEQQKNNPSQSNILPETNGKSDNKVESNAHGHGCDISKSEVKSIINSMIEDSPVNKFYNKLNELFNEFDRQTAINRAGGNISGYFGDMNDDLMLEDITKKNPEFEWWQEQNEYGIAGGKKHLRLNLFQDNSGSYGGNVQETNEIISALMRLEKARKDFVFDIVHISSYNNLIPHEATEAKYIGKNMRGTYFEQDFKERCFMPLQKTEDAIINILLLDGLINDYSDGEKSKKCFNASNCYVVSDCGNEYWLKSLCPQSHKSIIDDDYSDHLKDELLKAIGILLKASVC